MPQNIHLNYKPPRLEVLTAHAELEPDIGSRTSVVPFHPHTLGVLLVVDDRIQLGRPTTTPHRRSRCFQRQRIAGRAGVSVTLATATTHPFT